MGIKKFFGWCKNRFSDDIHHLKSTETISDLKEESIANVSIDNCMIDMNGLFHNSAQKAFEYGNHKPPKRLLGYLTRPRDNVSFRTKQQRMFEDVCQTIEQVVHILKPKKRLILCVDGPAPRAKMAQQMRRRFVSARELANEPNRSFDSNCLTPGTKFMDYLTKYIDWYIRKQVSNPHSVWFNLEIVYSNEKNPSEGEHKLLSFLRKHGNKEESYCIYGMDADLIMLVLASHTQNFYILRENPIEEDFAYYFVDMKSYRRDLIELMKWPETKHQYKPENAINDFVFMCFTVGNDFLPHIPAIEIVEGGIDMMLNVYKTACEEYGHLTRISSHGVRFRKNALKIFLGTLSQYEKGVLENKLAHKDMFFPDAILERNATFVNGKIELDIEQYRKEYYLQNIPELKDTNTLTEEQLCHHYLEGMQWVLSYYTKGVPDWQWKFPYHYAPFAYTIAKHIDTFEFKEYSQTFPATPFVQLLSILPPNSAHLLPYPLNSLLTSANSPLAPYCPTQFVVDVSGMMNEWEGIVLLPMIDFNTVNNICQQHIEQVDERDRRRNIVGKSFIYKRGRFSQLFKSVYGDLQSCAELKVIDI